MSVGLYARAEAPAPSPGATGDHEALPPVPKKPSRLLTAGAGLALLFVLVFGLLGARSLYEAPAATSPSPSGTPSAATVSTRLDAATLDVLSASTAAQAGFATFAGIPTPARVATVTDPYVDSLQLYETILTDTPVPAQARTAEQALSTLVSDDIAYFGGAREVSPGNLGAFLLGFFSRVSQLQAATNRLEYSLPT